MTANAPPSTRRLKDHLLLAALTLAFLLPFLNKAFHIDDPLFVWTAKWICLHPGDPYSFPVNWYNRLDTMDVVTQNPPLACYYLALAGTLLGWSEPALHAAMLLPALGVILGTYRLACRFCSHPLLAGLATLAMPVFLISSTTVMCDTLMLCFWVWAMVLWVEALDRGPGRFAAFALPAAGILASAAVMTKYFGVSLIPLLLVYALARRRFVQPLALLIPIAVLIAYQLWTRHLYGQGLLGKPIAYVNLLHQGRHLGLSLLNLMSGAGGCLLPAVLLFPLLVRPPLRWLAGLLFCLVLLALVFDHSGNVKALSKDGQQNYLLAIQLALFTVGGLAILMLTAIDLRQRRDADALLLSLWIFGTFVFTGFINWTVNGRSILPMAPAVGILLARRWDARAPRPTAAGGLRLPDAKAWDWRWLVPLGLSAPIALAAAWADQSVANANRAAARYITQKYAYASGASGGSGAGGSGVPAAFRGNGKGAAFTSGASGTAGRLWFEGHWGFQYYMQEGPARPVSYLDFQFNPGDFIAFPLDNSNIRKVPGSVVVYEEHLRRVLSWISVQNTHTGAGFYTDLWGSAPFVFGPVKPEEFRILKVTKPMNNTQVKFGT